MMAWRRPDDKPLSEPMVVNLLKYLCTRPQWVKRKKVYYSYGHILFFHVNKFVSNFSRAININISKICYLTPLMPRPGYCEGIRSMPWVLMPLLTRSTVKIAVSWWPFADMASVSKSVAILEIYCQLKTIITENCVSNVNTWLVSSQFYKQSWYWLYRIFLSSRRKHFHWLFHFNIDEWCRIKLDVYISSNNPASKDQRKNMK